MNIVMNSLTNMHWLEKIRAKTTTQFNNHRRLLASFHEQQIHSTNLWNTLYEEIYWNKMAMHWEERDRMGQDCSTWVNWEACEAAMK